jgi:ABC-2 type transport system permease protein
MKKYWTVAQMGWQDALVYRANAFIWVLYAALPAITLMLVWRAAYASGTNTSRSGLNLSEMMSYYVCVTALSIVITPHPEWETAMQIRDGKLTAFIVRPIGYYGHRVAQETSYQMLKSLMMLPSLGLMLWIFHEDLKFPALDVGRWSLFILAALLSYILLTQIKFLLGISAFWIVEPAGFLELWHTLLAVLGGRLLPLGELPPWVQAVATYTPFASLYTFPVGLFMGTIEAGNILPGFAMQLLWIALLTVGVRFLWQRGLLAYEAYGG